jgi:hypothetical protein
VLTLVTGAGASARERRSPLTLSDLHQDGAQAVILEGLASGNSPLDDLPSGHDAVLAHRARLPVLHRQSGFACNIESPAAPTPRISLHRRRGQRHLDQLRSWLQSEPYDQLLRLTSDLNAESLQRVEIEIVQA